MTGMDDKVYTWHPRLGSDQQQKTYLKINLGQLFIEEQPLMKDIFSFSYCDWPGLPSSFLSSR